MKKCTDEDWSGKGSAQEGIALSPYKEKQVSRAMEPGDSYFEVSGGAEISGYREDSGMQCVHSKIEMPTGNQTDEKGVGSL